MKSGYTQCQNDFRKAPAGFFFFIIINFYRVISEIVEVHTNIARRVLSRNDPITLR